MEESLALYEPTLDEGAGKIIARLNAGDKLRMMWVSGPSSSGKTTTTVKLTERLEKQGLRFLMLNLDDYFWSLVEHPTDWINDRNYETPEAMDIQLLNQHLKGLLAGETIEKPVYSFKEGRRIARSPSSWRRTRSSCWIACTGCIRRSPRASRRRRSSGSTSRRRTCSSRATAAASAGRNSPTCG